MEKIPYDERTEFLMKEHTYVQLVVKIYMKVV